MSTKTIFQIAIGATWYEWPNDPIKLDEFFYKLICTGTDDYYGQTINTWIIGS